MQQKEDIALILDFLPNGYFGQGKRIPIAQAIGKENFTLLHLVPRKGITLKLKEEVYIGSGKRDKINFIQGRISGNKLTETAKTQLAEFITQVLNNEGKRFVEFFNKAEPINTRLHQLELLPGFGKKHTKMIISSREDKVFESFEDIKQRIKNIPDPKKSIEKRLLEEIETQPKYRLFTS